MPGFPGLQLGISPVSSAATSGDMSYEMPQFTRGPITFGGGGVSETPVSGLIRDGALVLVLVFGARWLWGRMK